MKMTYLEKTSKALNRWANWVAGGALIAMMLLTVVNIVMREVYVAFGGTAELVGFLAATAAALALGYTQINRGHVAIDLFLVRLPRRAQMIIDTLVSFISMALFGVIAWQVAELATSFWRIGVLSDTLMISLFPFAYIVALGCALLSLALLVDCLKLLVQVMKR
jgi:TRAP-type C4-dicarboxylate transport system permease small subunit